MFQIPQQVEDLLTPVLCRNLGASQESQDGLPKSHKSNKQSQDYDDSDRSVVEETPQKYVFNLLYDSFIFSYILERMILQLNSI